MNANVDKLINNIINMILNPIIGFMFAIAVVFFIFGIVEFMIGAENEDKRETGKKHMIWGVIGMFAMVSVYGILNVLGNFWVNIGAQF